MKRKTTNYGLSRKRISKFFTTQKEPDCEFKQLLDKWLEVGKSRGLSNETLYNYSDIISRFHWWWCDFTKYGKQLGTHPKNITPQHCKEFITYLRTPQENRWNSEAGKLALSEGSIGSYGKVIKAFYNWLEAEDIITTSPFNHKSVSFASGGKKQERIIKYLTSAEIGRIFEVLTHPVQLQKFSGIRDLAMFALLLDTGIRRGELLNLKLADIDVPNRRCIVQGKSGRRYVNLSDKCASYLVSYLKARRDEFEGSEEYLWVSEDGNVLDNGSFRSVVARLNTRSGIKFHVHQFRHSYALIMSTQVSVFELRDLLGHTSTKTTEIYVQQNPERLASIQRYNSPLTTLGDKVPGLKRKRGRKGKRV